MKNTKPLLRLITVIVSLSIILLNFVSCDDEQSGSTSTMPNVGNATSNPTDMPSDLNGNDLDNPEQVNQNDFGLDRTRFSTQTYEAKNIDGSITTFQCSAEYNNTLNLTADSVMVYVRNRQGINQAFPTWMDKEQYQIDLMVALNRDHSDWCMKNPSKLINVQTRRDGSLYRHGGLTDSYDFYMVPTEDWIEYVWDIIEPCISKYSPRMIALEEPEMWHDAGYSQAFRNEWKNFYNEDWQTPTRSPATMYKAEQLKKFLIERIIKEISSRIKEKSPETKVYLATHSTLNYNSWSIMTGLNHYMSLGALDGVIGQTWSDTLYYPVKYEGSKVNQPFASAFLEYASYTDSVKNGDFFALADPKADAPDYTWDTYEYLYRHSVTASLLQPEIQRFELFPWPDRSFTPAPAQYKAYQLNVFNALKDISGKAVEIFAGTSGIGVLLSDTISWQYGNTSWTQNTAESIYGLTMPLIKKGIPVKFKALELIKSKEDLKDIKTLVVSYDCMKPLTDTTNKVIAEWVNDGGTLIYIGGWDKFEEIDTSWWHSMGTTPANHLFSELGLDLSLDQSSSSFSALNWTGDKKFSSVMENNSGISSFRGIFSGKIASENSILKSGNLVIGVEAIVGKGNFVGFSIPSAYFSQSAAGAATMRGILNYALTTSDSKYTESNLMLAKRGKYVTAYAIDASETLKGNFINIYDNELSVLNSVTIAPDSSVLLYDISDIKLNDTPIVIYNGGTLSDKKESSAQTSYNVSGPFGSPISQRILAKKGMYPQDIAATLDGRKVPAYYRWDNETSSLLVQVLGSVNPTTVEIKWGSKECPSDTEIIFKDINVETNNKNLDSEFLLKNAAEAHEYYRYCDLDSYLIYKIDLQKYPDAVVTLDLFQNYLIEVSGNGKDFVETHNYKTINKTHIRDGSNRTAVCLNSSLYADVTDEFYIRISNTDKKQGWGGSVFSLSVMYHSPK